MLRLRPYKSCDSKHIADWIKNEETFVKWGGERFGSYPINAKIIDDKYRLNNGDCVEDDNFYPMTAFDDSGVVGHFIMRYINGNNKILRFGWVIVDDTQRGKGYGKQMLELGLKYAFEISGVERSQSAYLKTISLRTNATNQSVSMKLLPTATKPKP